MTFRNPLTSLSATQITGNEIQLSAGFQYAANWADSGGTRGRGKWTLYQTQGRVALSGSVTAAAGAGAVIASGCPPPGDGRSHDYTVEDSGGTVLVLRVDATGLGGSASLSVVQGAVTVGRAIPVDVITYSSLV